MITHRANRAALPVACSNAICSVAVMRPPLGDGTVGVMRPIFQTPIP